VTLHGLFDSIVLPQGSAPPKDFFVFYRIDVKEPCTVTLRVVDPVGNEIAGNWRDSLSQIGPMQTVWAVDTSRFLQPGRYVLELSQESDDLTALSLVRMQLIVEKEAG
jgi:3-polyprenyl-4-hydroxybenzoate decarboxylase